MTEPHPFLMDDLIVEHQRDLLREASVERQWRAPRPKHEPDSAWRSRRGLIPTIRRLAVAWGVHWMAVIILALPLATVAPVGVDASTLDQIVKSIAENVLGRDSVKAVRVSADATAVMRWEATTYRTQNSIAASRELLYDEAVLVTGAILGSLRDIRRITFTMVRGGQVLGTGEVSRSQNLVLRLVPQLGGGIYTKPDSRLTPYGPSGGGPGSLM